MAANGAMAARCTSRCPPLGHLLALKVTAANEQERAQVGELAEQIQEATGENIQLAFVDQG
jgi:hypothetical protein